MDDSNPVIAAPGHLLGWTREFQSFLLRGNIIDLAVGVIAGLVFNALVTSLVNDVIMQLVAVVFGTPNFGDLVLTINGAEIRYGNFLTALLNFVLTMGAVFFFIVKPINAMTARLDDAAEDAVAAPTQRECSECLAEVPAAARRCRFCTSPLEQVAHPS